MDYQEELKRLEINESSLGSDYWKPEAGQHKIKALSELEDADPYEEEDKEPQLRKQIKILSMGKEYIWNIPFGKTKASTYGQLCNLANTKNNTLVDVEFTVVVVGTGQNKRFTIVM